MSVQDPSTLTDAASGGVISPSAIYRHSRPHRGSTDVDAFLRAVVRSGASDMHLKCGQPPRLRIGGKLRKVEREAAPTEEFENRVLSLMNEAERAQLLAKGSVDFAYTLDDVRFRVNVYQQESGLSVAARIVPRRIPSFDELHLPPVVAALAESTRGLVLVSGTTGSGKSTTIAAMLQQINATRYDHILTIEDPIEFLYTPDKCLVNQREIGINVPDFPTALRAMVREDPDVVLIGEMRDAATFRAALQAADTGHLVFGTVHAANAPQTIARVLSLFDDAEKNSIRQTLVYCLQAIVTQKLLRSSAEGVARVPAVEGVARVPAVEVLIATPIVRKMIEEGRDLELSDVIATGDADMRDYTESLYQLVQQGLVDRESACLAAPSRQQLEMRLAGIRPSKRGIVG